MVFNLFNDEVCSLASRQDVLAKVDRIDRFPDLHRGFRGFRGTEICGAVEVRPGALKDGFLEREEAIHVPLPDVFLLRVDENREIEEI